MTKSSNKFFEQTKSKKVQLFFKGNREIFIWKSNKRTIKSRLMISSKSFSKTQVSNSRIWQTQKRNLAKTCRIFKPVLRPDKFEAPIFLQSPAMAANFRMLRAVYDVAWTSKWNRKKTNFRLHWTLLRHKKSTKSNNHRLTGLYIFLCWW